MHIKNLIKFHYNPKYTTTELGYLVDNLKEVGLKDFRDLGEKQMLVNELSNKYNGDSFIMLLKTVENGKHIEYLESAYEELSLEVKEAFKITALVHRFGMLCPIEIVKNSIKQYDWGEFTDNIVKGNGKGILLQERKTTQTDDPDLYFKTKHPVIAEALVKKMLTNADKNSLYKKIFANISISNFNATFIVDLIKNIKFNDKNITEGQLFNFYELAKKEFSTSSHFMLSYVTHIENTNNSIDTLIECIRELELIEANDEKRNHRIIHRKGCINFKIAKLLKKQNEPLSFVNKYLNIAQDWFEIKKQLDPSSDYSYFEYFKLLVWKLKNLNLDEENKVDIITNINSMYDEAKRIVFLNLDKITEVFEEFRTIIFRGKDSEYLNYLLEKYTDVNSRAKACILLYYYYEALGNKEKCNDFVDELKNYTDELSVVNFLFKYYGRNLHVANNRIRFFELTRQNDFLEQTSPLRYYYYSSIAEFYNYSFKEGKNHLYDLGNTKQFKFNPDFYLNWLNENGIEEQFEGDIIEEKKLLKVRVNKIFKTLNLIKGDYKDIKNGDEVYVKIRFMFDGLQAEIIYED